MEQLFKGNPFLGAPRILDPFSMVNTTDTWKPVMNNQSGGSRRIVRDVSYVQTCYGRCMTVCMPFKYYW